MNTFFIRLPDSPFKYLKLFIHNSAIKLQLFCSKFPMKALKSSLCEFKPIKNCLCFLIFFFLATLWVYEIFANPASTRVFYVHNFHAKNQYNKAICGHQSAKIRFHFDLLREWGGPLECRVGWRTFHVPKLLGFVRLKRLIINKTWKISPPHPPQLYVSLYSSKNKSSIIFLFTMNAILGRRSKWGEGWLTQLR